MVQYKTEALVLRSRRYREADGILTLLTRERGKVSAVARSIYKPTSKLRGGVQPFSLNMMHLNAGRSSLHSINQSECLNMFLPLRRNLDAMAQASYWAELLDCFTLEEQQDEPLFEMSILGFSSIASYPSNLTIHALEIRLIKQLGLAPSLVNCSSCGSALKEQSRQFFSASAGGLVCGSCAQEMLPITNLHPTVIGLWRSLEKIRIDKLDRIKVQPEVVKWLDKVLKDWIVYQLGKPMKSWRVFNKIGGVFNE